jgi:hypothetical protein
MAASLSRDAEWGIASETIQKAAKRWLRSSPPASIWHE